MILKMTFLESLNFVLLEFVLTLIAEILKLEFFLFMFLFLKSLFKFFSKSFQKFIYFQKNLLA